MKNNALVHFLVTAGLVLVGASSAYAGPEVNSAPGGALVAGKPAPGLAVHGFDVVAFFADGKPEQGNAKFSLVHKEATYRFSSQAHLDKAVGVCSPPSNVPSRV